MSQFEKCNFYQKYLSRILIKISILQNIDKNSNKNHINYLIKKFNKIKIIYTEIYNNCEKSEKHKLFIKSYDFGICTKMKNGDTKTIFLMKVTDEDILNRVWY